MKVNYDRGRVSPSTLSRLISRNCALCGLPSGQRSVCRGCSKDLPWLEHACARCGAALPPTHPASNCAACDPILPAGMRAVSALSYSYPINLLIKAAKFHHRQDLARTLGSLLAEYLARRLQRGDLVLPDLLLPVPLHRWRFIWRGFNQADEIAQPIGRNFSVPVYSDCCIRVHATSPQTGLTGSARRRNMRSAFKASSCLAGASVAIIDDVFTTGSTTAAVAQAARSSGAAHVQIWTVTRAEI